MSNREAQVISAICENGDISSLFSESTDELFTSYTDVVRGMKDYYYKFKTVPPVSVLKEKFRDFEPEKVEGATEYYVNALREEVTQNRIRNMLLEVSDSLKSDPSRKTLDLVQREVAALSRFQVGVKDVDVTDFESAERHIQAIRERSDAMGGSPGIPTGFKNIDAAYPTGLAPGHLMVVIGWPGRAKTWFTTKLAVNAFEQGHKPMIVSLEMSPETMRDRIYTVMGAGRFKNSDFSRGMINVDDFHEWGKRNFTDKSGFVLVSSEGYGDVTPATVQGKIDQHKPSIVFLDYHQLFTDNKKSNSEVERNRNISREFKRLAVSNGIPVVDITAATMSDVSDQDDPPMLSQVAWSKAIEYDADIAVAVHKIKDTGINPGEPAVVEIVSRKNRHGGEFALYLEWDINSGKINETFGP